MGLGTPASPATPTICGLPGTRCRACLAVRAGPGAAGATGGRQQAAALGGGDDLSYTVVGQHGHDVRME
ncbi:hypothetical protein [Actinopolymorpha alba]|uniref:hypothetical protein n=1 Tax=Actinopolymorpha alba TaxID=533267 RepID=UPI0012F702B0|nr:hypothetical protein [Actinopolymorpha alba]